MGLRADLDENRLANTLKNVVIVETFADSLSSARISIQKEGKAGRVWEPRHK